MQILGIKTCYTCRKARRALEAAGHAVTFRDVRDAPLTPNERRVLLDRFGEAKLINRNSATWRALSEAERAADADSLLAAHPALMKRPVIDDGAQWHLGWGAPVRAALAV